MSYARIVEQMVGVPLLVEQSKADAILAVLSTRAGFDVTPDAEATRERMAAEVEMRREMIESAARETGVRVEYADAGYTRAGGVAVIPVMGTLVQRRLGMEALSGMASYASLQTMLSAAAADSQAHTILLEVDSPGGQVAGVFDLSAYIEGLRGRKRIVAYANELAASAAYLIAASASEVVASRTSRLGSIGVVVTHIDRSKQLEKQGVAVTHIYAGEKKVDGSPVLPLPDDVKAEIQAEVDSTYALFTSEVDRLRNAQAGAARATKAGILTGQSAVDAGLADRVEPFSATFTRLVRENGQAEKPAQAASRMESHDMPEVTDPQAAAPAVPEPIAAAAVPVVAEAKPDAVAAERARISAILEHPEAAGRDALARHLAFKTAMSAEDAGAMLAVSEKKTEGTAPSAASDTALDRNMRQAGTPGIVSDTEVANSATATAGAWDSTITQFGGKP